MNNSQRINFIEINLQRLIDYHLCDYLENPGSFMVKVILHLKRILENYFHQAPLKLKDGAKKQVLGWTWGAQMKKLLKWLVQLSPAGACLPIPLCSDSSNS